MASNSSEGNAIFDPCLTIEARAATDERIQFISTIHDANTPNERGVLKLPPGTYEFYLLVTGFKVNPQSRSSDLETFRPRDWNLVHNGRTEGDFPSLAVKLKRSNSLDWMAEKKHRAIRGGSLVELGQHSVEEGMHKFFLKGQVGLITVSRGRGTQPLINVKVYNVEQDFDLEIIVPQEP